MTLLTMIVKMGEGLSKTCAIFFLTLLFSLPLGMIVALLRMSKTGSSPASPVSSSPFSAARR